MVRFRLLGEQKPKNFQIPFEGVTVTRDGYPKLIQYVRGSDSIFKEDHKGDAKPSKVWMQDGFLDVPKYETVLLELLKRHPWYGKKFDILDEDVEAKKDLEKFDLQEKALLMINFQNPEELLANAIAIKGRSMIGKSEVVARRELKKIAFEDPEFIINKITNKDYATTVISSLSLLKGTLVINATQTAVTWPNGNVVVHVAAGEDPTEKLSEFLSQNNEKAKVTLQTLGEKHKRPYVKKEPFNAEKEFEQVLSKKEETVSSQNTDDSSDDVEEELEAARKLYFEQENREVPTRYKNDLEWIQGKLHISEPAP